MDMILQLLKFTQEHKGSVMLVAGAALGLLLGLAIGWWWFPAEWTNATPGQLRYDFRRDYLLWVAEQRQVKGDTWAANKLGAQYWEEPADEVLENLAQECDQGTWAECDAQDATQLRNLSEALENVPAEEPAAGVTVWQRLQPFALVCGSLMLLTALVAGVWFLVTRLRRPETEAGMAEPGLGVPRAGEGPAGAEPVSWGPDGPPLAQFPTTYTLGDDHYDPSFSVEMDSGEFLGECGVGISETIGVGSPSKVTAFEVWLFDKSDIRTVTKVLMSDYAFHDEALRAKLAPKGEPVPAREGDEIILETKTLRVRARIVEVSYGSGNLPPNSFFERLTLDLAAWVKMEEMEASEGDVDAFTLPSA